MNPVAFVDVTVFCNLCSVSVSLAKVNFSEVGGPIFVEQRSGLAVLWGIGEFQAWFKLLELV